MNRPLHVLLLAMATLPLGAAKAIDSSAGVGGGRHEETEQQG